jgi:hypothetical protein
LLRLLRRDPRIDVLAEELWNKGAEVTALDDVATHLGCAYVRLRNHQKT